MGLGAPLELLAPIQFGHPAPRSSPVAGPTIDASWQDRDALAMPPEGLDWSSRRLAGAAYRRLSGASELPMNRHSFPSKTGERSGSFLSLRLLKPREGRGDCPLIGVEDAEGCAHERVELVDPRGRELDVAAHAERKARDEV